MSYLSTPLCASASTVEARLRRITAGTASSVLNVAASSSSQLSVSSPLSATPLYKETGLTVLQGTVYTVFVLGGGANAPQGILRCDRT